MLSVYVGNYVESAVMSQGRGNNLRYGFKTGAGTSCCVVVQMLDTPPGGKRADADSLLSSCLFVTSFSEAISESKSCMFIEDKVAREDWSGMDCVSLCSSVGAGMGVLEVRMGCGFEANVWMIYEGEEGKCHGTSFVFSFLCLTCVYEIC